MTSVAIGSRPDARRRRIDPSVAIAVTMLTVVLLVVVVTPILPSYDPTGQDLQNRFLPMLADPAHPLGTDDLGRDTLSRLAVAGCMCLLVAVPAVLISVVLGVLLGLCAGYFGGRLDNIISAISDIQLAMPVMLLLIAIVSALGPSIPVLVIVIGLANWVGYARVSRATAWSLREREFIWAPKTHGAGTAWILRRHLLPNALPTVLIMIPFDVGTIVLYEAAMSYLGLGIQAPTPSLGGMIRDGQSFLRSEPMLTVVPGVLLFMLIAGLQFLSKRLTSAETPEKSDR
ncbi:ABC transporter permease [Nocardia jinanensis]|uniref:Peptide ABC transporter permease n=1 Tax=Nocardia jinanensis TaxID=382504 RepID=A0A917REJ0_9NOCA|nr:ABC transporter permease [Nocardia jinanensis]GGL02364.1 peptide ABC transporter permease [Nocardia jinanensis]